jgi:hypothetical protein
MKQNEPDKPINDDILKCREDILRAGGLDPKASEPAPRKIPSFEEMISKQTEPVETETPEEIPAVEDVPDQFAVVEDVPEEVAAVENIPEEIQVVEDTVEEAIVLEDESEGSGMEVLADADWQLGGETVELVEDTENDEELEDILEDAESEEDTDVLMNSDQIDPSSPVVSKAEQEELLAEFDAIDEDDLLDDDDDQEDQAEFEKDIEEGLAAMSAADEKQDDDIPEFNVYDRILSDERKESSTRRQGPGDNGGAKNNVPAVSGTVGDIINKSKGDANNETPQENLEDKVSSTDTVHGIIHGHDNMNDIQAEIISDIVARQIAKYYGKTG